MDFETFGRPDKNGTDPVAAAARDTAQNLGQPSQPPRRQQLPLVGQRIRQLRKDRELRWAVGKQVSCWLQGGEYVRGYLTAVDADRLALDRDGQRVELERARVTKVRLEPDVKWPRRAAET